jgi:dTDP-4-amino-4,6-dideoxygalactose transaminase
MAGGQHVRSSLLVFGVPLIGEEEIAEVVDTLRSGWIGFGPKSIRLEKEFAEYVGCRNAISLSSCTAGLQLALVVAGIGPGDEVITTPLTFAATVNAIELAGAKPVLVDVDRATQNIDCDQVDAAITPRTRAILPVHMAGRSCDMDRISDTAERHGLTVVEDAAHAVEAVYRGRKVGNISTMTVFSFYATKTMTTAEGGMLTTDDDDLAERLRILRLHGLSADAWARYKGVGSRQYEVIEPGFKYNFTDLQASLGLHQLARLESNLAARDTQWEAYNQAFADVEGLECPAPTPPGDIHARHLYTLLIDPEVIGADRNLFIEALWSENISVGIHFNPVHLHSYYSERYGYRAGMFPNAEEIGSRTVSLPLSAGLSKCDVDDVIAAVRKVSGALCTVSDAFA